MVTLVTLTGFSDIFDDFRDSVEEHALSVPRVVVTSNGVQLSVGSGRWTIVPGVSPFIYARNANIGIRQVPHGDVILVNDDVTFTSDGFVSDLAEAAARYPRLGILSPLVMGGVGNPLQAYSLSWGNRFTISEERLAFVCVYIKRCVLDEVGPLDERFFGYGGDDDDYCARVQRAGYLLGVTPEVVVRHGFGGARSSSSFERTMGNTRESMHQMHRLLLEKNNEVC